MVTITGELSDLESDEIDRVKFFSSGLFKAIRKLDQKVTQAQVQWFKNWISFMDNMLQLTILGKDSRNLYVPTAIDKIVINSVRHMEELEKFEEPEPLLPVYVYHELNYCR